MAVVIMFAITLNAEQLYRGFEAHRVLLKGGSLVLDARNWTPGSQGRITTDVIDLGAGEGEGMMGEPVRVKGFRLFLDAHAPLPAGVEMQYRTGSTYFQAAGTWTGWKEADEGRALPTSHRYLQVRIILTTTDTRVLPEVRGLRIEVERVPAERFRKQIKVVEEHIERIVRSPIRFGYERQDQQDLVWLRKTFNLDRVIAGKRTEMEKIAALCRWVASRKNDRHTGWYTGHYPWNIRKLISERDGGTIFGHCASYCVVFITAVGSFGWQARHIANEGYKRRSHEVPEVWVNELRQWVYFDPSLDAYYVDARTGRPLSALDLHDVFLRYMYPDGSPMGDFGAAEIARQRERNRAIDWSTFPVRYVSGLWWYGERKQSPDFWHWGQGLMSCGYLQMTPRNNFHSQPRPYFTKFGYGPGSEPDFPYWVDRQTPLRNSQIRNWFTRWRDWYWTLNQASMRLVRTGEGTIAVELGTSQPFFRRFLVVVDGGRPQPIPSFSYIWRLHPGRNSLEVNCEDEFGNRGIPSRVVLEVGR